MDWQNCLSKIFKNENKKKTLKSLSCQPGGQSIPASGSLQEGEQTRRPAPADPAHVAHTWSQRKDDI